tara:strand:- start:3033 stop:3191 length:159 start_codon:yes stop_codon:yes gene_type:complete
MEKLKTIVKSPLFKAGLAAAAGVALMTTGNVLWAGIAFGIGIREFLLAFKTL